MALTTTSDDFIIFYDFAHRYMKELYGLGVRRIGVFSAPPLGCLPSQKTLNGDLGIGCVDDPNEAAKLFNAKLSAELGNLNNNLPHAKVVYIDVYNPLLDIIKNPKKYGNISLFFLQKFQFFLYIKDF